MTRKDYVLLAETIRDRKENNGLLGVHGWSEKDIELGHAVINDLAYFLASALAQDNKAFDRDRFLRDCGITN